MKGREATDTHFVEIMTESKEKMLHGEVGAKVELGPGRGRIVIPGDFQDSIGQRPVHPDLPEMVALLWAGTAKSKLFNDSVTRKSKLASLFNVPNFCFN